MLEGPQPETETGAQPATFDRFAAALDVATLERATRLIAASGGDLEQAARVAAALGSPFQEVTAWPE